MTNDERRETNDEGGKISERLGGSRRGIRKLDVMNKNEVIYC